MERFSIGAPLPHALLGHPAAFTVVSPLLHALIYSLLVCAGVPHCPISWTLYLIIALIPSAMYAARHGPTVWISNVVTVRVAATPATCSRFLHEAHNLSEYEQKVTGCAAWDHHASGCKFALWGWWWGLPWCKHFAMQHNQDGGFHAALDDEGWALLPTWLRFCGGGGFKLKEVSNGGTDVTHYERYGWPIVFPFVWLLQGPWLMWHRRGMEVEMAVVRAQIEGISAAAGSGDKSALVADHFPKGTWAMWKYSAGAYLWETCFSGKSATHPALLPRG
mmetsp:Transcript_11025/g.23191  ORF Transcript_11025/g.23191 Transcript_11025/m.23191 type:complete len:277 (+) Transcript_11025:37-867(+)